MVGAGFTVAYLILLGCHGLVVGRPGTAGMAGPDEVFLKKAPLSKVLAS
jgi:hypothetical protein